MTRAAFDVPADMRISELAAEHLRKHGSRRLTIVALAEELGMSHANVYRYFPSKSALLEAVATQWLKPIETGLREVADGPDPAGDKLERLLGGLHRAYRDKLETDPHGFDVVAKSFRDRASLARKHRARVQTEVRRVLEEGAATGAFVLNDPGKALAFVLDAAHRFIHPLCVLEDRDLPRGQAAARLQRVVDAILLAFSRRAPPVKSRVT